MYTSYMQNGKTYICKMGKHLKENKSVLGIKEVTLDKRLALVRKSICWKMKGTTEVIFSQPYFANENIIERGNDLLRVTKLSAEFFFFQLV